MLPNPAYLYTLLRHRLWPDPHRFYPPKPPGALPFLSAFTNTKKLRQQGAPYPVVFNNAQQLHAACQLAKQPNHAVILVPSHTSFSDPHVLVEWTLAHPDKAFYYMAGTEAFETHHGFSAFLIQTHGTFSVDRGIVDKHSLTTAQHLLAHGQHPLVLFAEGEANYCEAERLPFMPGAAQLGLKTLKQPHITHLTFVPIATHYPFVNTPPERFVRQYELTVGQWHGQHPSEPLPQWDSTLPMAAQAQALIRMATQRLWAEHFSDTPAPDDMTERCQTLIRYLATQLCTEHKVPMDDDAVTDISRGMALKNKLRSTIVRRCRILPTPWRTQHQHQLRRWQQQQHLNPWDVWLLGQAEIALIGQPNPTAPTEKRLTTLERCLAKHQAAEQTYQAATPQQRAQWPHHLNVCRQIKLLHLLLADTHRHLETPTQWEETRLKCHLMLTHQFQYTSPKQATVTIGQPITLTTGNGPLPDTTALTATLQHAVETLMAASDT